MSNSNVILIRWIRKCIPFERRLSRWIDCLSDVTALIQISGNTPEISWNFRVEITDAVTRSAGAAHSALSCWRVPKYGGGWAGRPVPVRFTRFIVRLIVIWRWRLCYNSSESHWFSAASYFRCQPMQLPAVTSLAMLRSTSELGPRWHWLTDTVGVTDWALATNGSLGIYIIMVRPRIEQCNLY